MKPAPVAIGETDHRRGHRDELVPLEVDERQRVCFADARGGEEQRGWDAENGREAREDRGARLLDTARLELGDPRARYPDPAGELGLREVQALARRSDREREGRPGN